MLPYHKILLLTAVGFVVAILTFFFPLGDDARFWIFMFGALLVFLGVIMGWVCFFYNFFKRMKRKE